MRGGGDYDFRDDWPARTRAKTDLLAVCLPELAQDRPWEYRVPIYQKVVDMVKEDLPILYLAKSVIPVAHRDYVKGHEFGMGTWFGYYGGGMKKVWFDK